MTYGERGTKKLENGKEKETRTQTEGKKENIIEKKRYTVQTRKGKKT